MSERDTELQWWPYEVIVFGTKRKVRHARCSQEGIMRFRLKRDAEAAMAAMEAVGHEVRLFNYKEELGIK
jgi:hypothetical protein